MRMDIVRRALGALSATIAGDGGGGGGAAAVQRDDSSMYVSLDMMATDPAAAAAADEDSTRAYLEELRAHVFDYYGHALKHVSQLYFDMMTFRGPNGARYWRIQETHPIAMVIEATAAAYGYRSPTVTPTAGAIVVIVKLMPRPLTFRERVYHDDTVRETIRSLASLFASHGLELDGNDDDDDDEGEEGDIIHSPSPLPAPKATSKKGD